MTGSSGILRCQPRGNWSTPWNRVAGPEPGFIGNGPVKGTHLLKDLASYVNGLNLKAPAPVPDSLRAIVAPMDVPNVQKKQNGTIWVGSTLKDELMKPSNRREFSLLTCSGCHSAETNIQPFTHVRPRAFNYASSLSSFMVGPAPKVSPIQLSRVTDPVAGAGLPVKEFNDAHRRALDLVDLVFNFKCEPTSPIPDPGPITYTPLPFTH